MNFKNIIFALSIVMCTVLLFACKKDSDTPVAPVVTPPEDTIPVPVKVSLMTRLKYYTAGADTANLPAFDYSVIYNGKNQVEKIQGLGGLSSDTITYAFFYNTTGAVVKMTARSTLGGFNQNYFVHYDNKSKVDSLSMDSDIFGNPFEIKSSLTYDSKGNLADILAKYIRTGDTSTLYHYTYFRSNKIDSIYTDYVSENSRNNSRFTTPVQAGAADLTIDQSILLMMAVRDSYVYFTTGRDNIYLQQFLNPNDAIMASGEKSAYSMDDSSAGQSFSAFKSVFAFNADSTLNAFQYLETTNGELKSRSTYKFEFTTK